jgi:general secretion pathway protein J
MRGIQTTFMAKKKSHDVLDHLAELENAYLILQNDLVQIIKRPVKNFDGSFKPAIYIPVDDKSSSGEKAAQSSENGYNRLEFTRTGNNMDLIKYPSSDLERVAYYLKDDMLVRHSWRQVDATEDTFVDKRRILSEVTSFSLYFIDELGRKSENWGSTNKIKRSDSLDGGISLPKGIVINFSIKNYGNIEWVYAL